MWCPWALLSGHMSDCGFTGKLPGMNVSKCVNVLRVFPTKRRDLSVSNYPWINIVKNICTRHNKQIKNKTLSFKMFKAWEITFLHLLTILNAVQSVTYLGINEMVLTHHWYDHINALSFSLGAQICSRGRCVYSFSVRFNRWRFPEGKQRQCHCGSSICDVNVTL